MLNLNSKAQAVNKAQEQLRPEYKTKACANFKFEVKSSVK